MDSILWTLRRSDGIELLGAVWRPLLIAMVLYYSGYLAVWLSTLARAARVVPLFRGLGVEAPDVLLVLPTLVNGRKDLDQLRAAAATVLGNGYPGRLVVCLAIDGSDDNAPLIDELEAWARDHGQRAAVLVARVPKRAGKGVAVAAGLERAQQAVRHGEIPRPPPVFFNMDADGVLGARALERMVAKLVTPGWLTRQRPMIVASNVMVRRSHYWQGLGKFFTMRYQLALQVAREYMTSISISRNNRGILPVTGVSGALYCTWTQLHVHQGRHALVVRCRAAELRAVHQPGKRSRDGGPR
jgi:cellulose synthase/poly-beta-1,6-N-acetylglucosamine synthase-like glycosyltransferase